MVGLESAARGSFAHGLDRLPFRLAARLCCLRGVGPEPVSPDNHPAARSCTEFQLAVHDPSSNPDPKPPAAGLFPLLLELLEADSGGPTSSLSLGMGLAPRRGVEDPEARRAVPRIDEGSLGGDSPSTLISRRLRGRTEDASASLAERWYVDDIERSLGRDGRASGKPGPKGEWAGDSGSNTFSPMQYWSWAGGRWGGDEGGNHQETEADGDGARIGVRVGAGRAD